jgi:hypothetical protein
LFDPGVGFATRTHPGFRDEFIESQGSIINSLIMSLQQQAHTRQRTSGRVLKTEN